MELAHRSQTAVFLPPLKPVAWRTLKIIAWLFTSLSAAFLVTRLSIRFHSFRRLGWDDAFVIVAWLLLLSSSIIWQAKRNFVQWQYEVDVGKAEIDEAFEFADVSFLHDFLALMILFYSCLWSVKYSFLFFFHHLYPKGHVRRFWWWVVFATTTAGLIASVADLPYGCLVKSPQHIFTECNDQASNRRFSDIINMNMAIDVFTDILILSIPFVILWSVQISRKQKVILFTLFSVTVLIMIVAIIRALVIKPNTSLDQTVSLEWIFVWSLIQMGVSIMIACVASFRQFFVGKARRQSGDPDLGKHWLSSWSRRKQRLNDDLSSSGTSIENSFPSFYDQSDSSDKQSGEAEGHWATEVTMDSLKVEQANFQHTTYGARSIRVQNTIDIASEYLPAQPQVAYKYQQRWDATNQI